MFNGYNPPKSKRHNNGLHIAHDSCYLFTGPTLKKQKYIILAMPRRKACSAVPQDLPSEAAKRDGHTVCSVAPTLRCVAQKDILDKFLPCRRTCFIPVPLSAHNSVMLYELCFGIRNTVVGNSEFHTVLSKYHVSSSGKSASGSAPGCEIACRCLRKFVSMDLIVGELNMDDMFAS